MELKSLKIGNLTIPIPIIQGGMATRISTAKLAAAVANEGGVGIIAATGMSTDELKEEIRLARKLSNGVIGINMLFAAKQFANNVLTALEEGIDLVISGAGFSRDMFGWGKKYNTPIIPIVSSAKLAIMSEKLGASAVIVEGVEAGGHLGTDRSMREILPEVKKSVSIPVIGAGGVVDGKDIAEVIKLGADGVQMGTRFAASLESNASPEFKELYLRAQENDVVLVKSPVGLPGRALKTNFTDLVASSQVKIKDCKNCLKQCSHRFCIFDALDNAQQGDIDNGLVFAGQKVTKIKEILSVKDIFKNLLSELRSE